MADTERCEHSPSCGKLAGLICPPTHVGGRAEGPGLSWLVWHVPPPPTWVGEGHGRVVGFGGLDYSWVVNSVQG